jgi:hypothetical protein
LGVASLLTVIVRRLPRLQLPCRTLKLIDELEPRVIGEPRRSAFQSLAVPQERRDLRAVGASVEHADDGRGDLPKVEPSAIPLPAKQLLHTRTPASVFVHRHCRFRHEVGRAKVAGWRCDGRVLPPASGYVLGGGSTKAQHDVELDYFPFGEVPGAGAFDGRAMDEAIGLAVGPADESEAFGVTEGLHHSCCTHGRRRRRIWSPGTAAARALHIDQFVNPEP